MSTEKKASTWVKPKLPKSLAREYNLKTFIEEMDMPAMAVWYDAKFRPTFNEERWCAIHANLVGSPPHNECLEVPAHSMQEVECGFDIMIPPGHELHFRPVRGSKWLLQDASNINFRQRRVRVNIVNLGLQRPSSATATSWGRCA